MSSAAGLRGAPKAGKGVRGPLGAEEPGEGAGEPWGRPGPLRAAGAGPRGWSPFGPGSLFRSVGAVGLRAARGRLPFAVLASTLLQKSGVASLEPRDLPSPLETRRGREGSAEARSSSAATEAGPRRLPAEVLPWTGRTRGRVGRGAVRRGHRARLPGGRCPAGAEGCGPAVGDPREPSRPFFPSLAPSVPCPCARQ